MLDVILDSPSLLVAMIVVLLLFNYAAARLVLRDFSRQSFVEREAFVPPGPVGRVRSERGRLALAFPLAIGVILLTLLADRQTGQIVGGGYLVLLGAGAALNITSLLGVRTLVNPAAAEGRIRYSAMYRYRMAAAQTLGFALFSGAVGILFGSLAFMAGSVFLLATAIGNYRRARQASRRTV